MLIFTLFAFSIIFSGAHALEVKQNKIDSAPIAPPPDGYIHRPVMEFFTGLSCPSCMGDGPDAESPENSVHETYLDGRRDPETPFTTVVFHELNGGGVDDLNNDEATDRMRYYQPGLSGTPDLQFDGGYIEIGGFSASQKPIDKNNIEWAIGESKTRYDDKPLRPLERLQWSFPYVRLEVDQIYEDGSFVVDVKVTYDGNAKTVGAPRLQGSLYVFMVEDNVTAYSLVYDMNVTNDAVFRGYAFEDETFSLDNREEQIFTTRWDIPDAKVPIKPQDMKAVAVVYDRGDTDSSPGGSDGNQRANSPRALQSATSDSTAFDRENEPASVSSVELTGESVTVTFEDDGGVARAYLFANTVNRSKPEHWTPYELVVTGEEICDDQGTCYAYSDPIGTVDIEYEEGPLYVQILSYDDEFAQSSSSVYQLVEGDMSIDDKSSSSLPAVSFTTFLLVSGVLLIIGAPILYLVSRKRKGKFFKIGSSIGTFAILVALGIIMVSIGGASQFMGITTTVPDFEFKDADGITRSPEVYQGKVLVIDIMFTTCSSCNKEMPDVVDVYENARENWGTGVEFLSVSVDDDDTNGMMVDFQREYGAEWPIGKDPSFVEKFDALEVPKMVIIAPNGDIAYEHTGLIDREEVMDAIEAAHDGTYSKVAISQTGGSLIALGFAAAIFGVVTFFSPCSFPMLPGYFSYYISSQSSEDGKKASPVKGGLLAGAGIIAFFLLIGIFVALFGAAIQGVLEYLMPAIGVILLILGFLSLTGKDAFLEKGMEYAKKPFTYLISTVKGKSVTDQSGNGGLFAYGFGYGAAASSCMAPAFIGVILLGFAAGGLIGGMLIFSLYALAIGSMMIIFSFLAASGGTGLQKIIGSTDKIKKISGALLMLAGLFVIWYSFWGYKYLGGLLSF